MLTRFLRSSGCSVEASSGRLPFVLGYCLGAACTRGSASCILSDCSCASCAIPTCRVCLGPNLGCLSCGVRSASTAADSSKGRRARVRARASHGSAQGEQALEPQIPWGKLLPAGPRLAPGWPPPGPRLAALHPEGILRECSPEVCQCLGRTCAHWGFIAASSAPAVSFQFSCFSSQLPPFSLQTSAFRFHPFQFSCFSSQPPAFIFEI